MHAIDSHLIKQSITGIENECGDTGVVIPYDGGCFISLVDVLGHGKEAHEVAILAETFFSENHAGDIVDIMNGFHNHLKGTRGAVAFLSSLDLSTGILTYCGIGNITAKVYGIENTSLVSRDGVIGYGPVNPKKMTMKLYPGDMLILHSDGLKTHFNREDYPGFFYGNARYIASNLINHLRKGDDDASCIVLRYGV